VEHHQSRAPFGRDMDPAAIRINVQVPWECRARNHRNELLTVDVAALHLSRSPRDARANRHGLTLARPSGLSRCKSDPVSLDVVWTTMTAAKEAEHERQGAEAHHDTFQ